MGTSSDHEGGSGGHWTAYKRAASYFARHGGPQRGRQVLSRHVAALGGASTASTSAISGRSAGKRAGRFLSGLAMYGLDRTLEDLGLQHLIGSSRFEVVAALIDYLAGESDSREAAAARDAACDLIDDLFGDAVDYDQIAAATVDAAGVEQLLTGFLTRYTINRAEIVSERLNRHADAQQAVAREEELSGFVQAIIELQIRDLDPLAVDWDGSQGACILDATFDALYEQLESLE